MGERRWEGGGARSVEVAEPRIIFAGLDACMLLERDRIGQA
jgi:hypothetical protein